MYSNSACATETTKPQMLWNKKPIEAIRSALFREGHRTVLVHGPPGSGKTWLTTQLAIEAGERYCADRQHALILTFTVNAVDQIEREMRDWRQAHPGRSPRTEVLNYHALYKRLLDAYVRYCGVPRTWRTWLPHEVDAVLREVNPEARTAYDRHNHDARRMQWELSNATSIVEGLMDPDLPFTCNCQTLDQANAALLERHREGLLHYDSWPYFAYRILQESEVLRRHIGSRYPFILVDEFQDTNGVEWHFLRELAHRSSLVCMADPDQAIYLWKGAAPEARLQALREDRGLESEGGFALRQQPRTEDNPQLARLAPAIKVSCRARADVVGGLGSCLEVRPVKMQKGDTQRETGGEWAAAYAKAIKSAAREAVGEGKRVAVLCPTWPLLRAVSYHLRTRTGGARLDHGIVGLDTQVGAMLAALAYALRARLKGDPAHASFAAAESALESLQRVPAKEAPGARWFGPRATCLEGKPNRKRRDAVRQHIREYVARCPDAVRAVHDLPKLAAALRDAMKEGRKSSLWLAGDAVGAPIERWCARLADHCRRNPDVSADTLEEAAWAGVEGAAAHERRVIARRDLVIMTAHAVKGKEFHQTYVCGASAGTRHFHATMRHPERCQDVRNLLYVACSRSREKVVILHKEDQPCCLLGTLQGDACPHSPRDGSMTLPTMEHL